jgi:hypothetical protein
VWLCHTEALKIITDPAVERLKAIGEAIQDIEVQDIREHAQLYPAVFLPPETLEEIKKRITGSEFEDLPPNV